MKSITPRKTLLFSAIPLLLLGLAYFLFMRPTGEINVLIFSKTEQFRHASIETGVEAIKQLGIENKFSVEATEDAEIFKETSLRQFNVVVFLNTTGDVLNETQQIELNRFIQAGGGFVGLHAAADTEYDWPWYGELIGGWFKGHPMDPNVRSASVQVVAPQHESAKHLPVEWTLEDEWYDYRAIHPEVTPILLIDESTYKRDDEDPATEPRPISWHREFDGGRMFYTGVGHTKESFSDPLVLDHIYGGIKYASGEGKPVDFNNATVAPEEYRFIKNVLVQNLNEPMELDLLGEGLILFVERDGAVKIHDESTGTTETIETIDTFSDIEEGLLGVAVDPNYASNNWVYLFYSAPEAHEILLSRFELKDKTLDMASEKVLLTVPVQRDECCHVAGSLEFGPEGNLFVSIGDNTSPRETGYAPIDEREGRSAWDAQKSSSNTNDLRGSILRITPEEDGTYSIPEGNLFAKDGSEGRPEIYVMGNRNPFRISIDQRTGYLYWGEVGPDGGKDSTTRGSKGYDEVNQARKAGFFGWPYFIGDNSAYDDYDFEMDASGGLFNPAKPINNSPNNTGATELPPTQPALIWYSYGQSEDFPLVGEGSRNAMAGPVYYYDDYQDSPVRIPEYYDGKLFIYDWMRGWIMAVTLDENGDYVRMEPFLPNSEFINPMDMLFAPDGSLYMLEYGPLWFAGSPEAKLSRIEHIKGNLTPSAAIASNRQVGATPLTVEFSSASIDYDRGELSYLWNFGNGSVSNEKDPTFVFETPGTYQVSLTVTDPDGASSEASIEILAGNDMPEIAIDIEQGNRTFYWDDTAIRYNVVVTDKEDGALETGAIDPSLVTLTIDYLERGNDLALPALGHQAAMDASLSLIGQALIEGSDCSACHQPDVSSVGPSYTAIADRYGATSNITSTLVEKIINGGSGTWGEAPMPPHPQLSPLEAEKMVEYILSIDGNTDLVESAPLTGTFTQEIHKGKNEEGTYILMATYTDQGGQEIGPLTARKSIQLRNPRMLIAHFDDMDGGQKMTAPSDAPGGLGGALIYLGSHDSWARYEDIDLTDVAGITGTFIVAPTFTTGGWVDVHLDAMDGPLLGTFEVKQSLTNIGEVDVDLEFEPRDGMHDLYLVYRNKDEEGLVCIGRFLNFKHVDQQAL